MLLFANKYKHFMKKETVKVQKYVIFMDSGMKNFKNETA